VSRARDLADAGSKANFLDNVSADINTTYAPKASPQFTGTITAPDNSISGDAVHGGEIGAGTTFNGTLGNSTTFPSGTVLQVVDTSGTAKVDMAFGSGGGAINITSLNITSSAQASYFYLSFSGVTFNTNVGHNVRKGIRIGTTSTGSEVEEWFTEYTHTDVRIKQPTFVQAKVTPSTSTAYTYYCSLFRDNSAGFYLNDNASPDGTWMFKCIEVAQ
tara:strand:- start:198 stop:848 length:651 start_codon:yes stop_codon:yes gene_type:complete